jgi:hypothetical protein
MKKNNIIAIAWIAIIVLAAVLRVPDWFMWSLLLIVFLIGVLDYYWIGGKLIGRSYK